MKKTLKYISIMLAIIISSFILFLAISSIIYGPEYIYRCLINLESKVGDYKFFSSIKINKSNNVFRYEEFINEDYSNIPIKYNYHDKENSNTLFSLLEQSNTTSFVVIKNDKLVYEKYLNGYKKNSICTSFSSVKSIDSLMIGIAIDEGYIKDEDDPIVKYISEYENTSFKDITIKQLLMMRSKIKYEEGGAWFGDDAKTYYYPDLRDLALNKLKVDKDYSDEFHYNNYHPLILGMILERSTGKSVSKYFEEKIWNKIGAEYDASWSIDSNKTKFEKMESGLNFVTIDYAKIGSMLLHDGVWNNQRIVSSEWLNKSLIAEKALTKNDNEFLNNKQVGYQYMWYSIPNSKGGFDFFASGKYGQILYVSRENNTVIVRTGSQYGNIDWWPEILKQVSEESF